MRCCCICASVPVTVIRVLTIHWVWRVQIYISVRWTNGTVKKWRRVLRATPARSNNMEYKFAGIVVNTFVSIVSLRHSEKKNKNTK